MQSLWTAQKRRCLCHLNSVSALRLCLTIILESIGQSQILKKQRGCFFGLTFIYLFINIQENNASEFLANKLIFLYLGVFFFYKAT